jgi:hypothetical protein
MECESDVFRSIEYLIVRVALCEKSGHHPAASEVPELVLTGVIVLLQLPTVYSELC